MNSEMFNRLSSMLGNSDFSRNSGNFNTSNNFNNNTSNFFNNEGNSGFDFSNIDMETLMKIKNIMSKMNSNSNNPRSNLLLSLKPYLKPSRKQKLNQYIQLMNMTSIMEEFNKNTGYEK